MNIDDFTVISIAGVIFNRKFKFLLTSNESQ